MKNISLKKIADKLFDDSIPDRFIDFLVAEMTSCKDDVGCADRIFVCRMNILYI